MLLVPTTQPEDIASYANRVANAWKIGRKQVGDGVLLVVAKNDRKVRIEVAKSAGRRDPRPGRAADHRRRDHAALSRRRLRRRPAGRGRPADRAHQRRGPARPAATRAAHRQRHGQRRLRLVRPGHLPVLRGAYRRRHPARHLRPQARHAAHRRRRRRAGVARHLQRRRRGDRRRGRPVRVAVLRHRRRDRRPASRRLGRRRPLHRRLGWRRRRRRWRRRRSAAAASAPAAAATSVAAAPREAGDAGQDCKRILRHRWLDEADTRKAIPPALVERLAQRVAASERRHTGEIRICVEAVAAHQLPAGATPRRASAPSRCSASCASGTPSTTTAC